MYISQLLKKKKKDKMSKLLIDFEENIHSLILFFQVKTIFRK